MVELSTFIETIQRRAFFAPGTAITVARAPGRLDVMGGIADYSGSLVLQRPTAEATFAAVQPMVGRTIQIVSIGSERGRDRLYSTTLDALSPHSGPLPYSTAQQSFRGPDHWAAYTAGALLVLMRERGAVFRHGVRILLASSVPEGKGVASSAALEVATMKALAGAFAIPLDGQELAVLSQIVENRVAGAPCGLMDQMASAVGEEGTLMAMLCQPAELQPAVGVPQEIAFWGIDSGERHAVTGSDYASVRAGAFMAYRLMSGNTALGGGYLANVSPSWFEREFAAGLPEHMPGAEFLRLCSGTADAVTTVDPSRTYRIRQPAAHPIYEHHRVKLFRQLLSGRPSEELWTSLGELMYQSHASYSACGLGSPGTDALVDLVVAAGPAAGLYGARITGGGSGGTVAVLSRSDAEQAVLQVAQAYEKQTGHKPHIFAGSSGGAQSFGTITVNL